MSAGSGCFPMDSRLRVAVLAGWLALLLGGLWYVATRVGFTTDLRYFLPRGGDPEHQSIVDWLWRGEAARVALVAISADTPQRAARLSREVAAALRAGGLFASVANGADDLGGSERELVDRYRYLLSPKAGGEALSVRGLRQALEQRLRELESPLAATVKATVASDPTGELQSVLASWAGSGDLSRRFGVWFRDATGQALLIAVTKAAATDIDAQHEAVAAVERAFAAARGAEPAELILSGGGVLAARAQEIVRGEVNRLGVVATVVLTGLLLLAYRSIHVVALSVIPVVSGLLAGAVVVGLVFGELHGITLAFGATLIGVASDYPIHVLGHLTGRTPVADEIRQVWPTLLLGALATAAGYTGLFLGGFAGLTQIAVFTVAGLVAAVVSSRWVLGAALPLVWRLPVDPGRFRWLDPLLLPGAWTRAGVGLVGACCLASWLAGVRPAWEPGLATLNPVPSSLQAVDRQLRAALGAADLSHAGVVAGATAEEALQRSEHFARLAAVALERGLIAGLDHPARYLPSVATQRERQRDLPTADQLAARLHEALDGLPFRAGALAPFVEAVAAARVLEPLRLPDLAGSTLGARVESQLFERDGRWFALVSFRGVADPDGLREWLRQLQRPWVKYVDLREASGALAQRLRETTTERVAIGAAIILAILAFGLRSPRRVLEVSWPLVTGVAATVVLLGLLGARLTPFHLVSLLLVAGLSMDYALFFSRSEPEPAQRRRTAYGLLVCTVLTTVGFGILAASDLPVLQAIGSTVALGTVASFLAAWASTRPGAGEATMLDD